MKRYLFYIKIYKSVIPLIDIHNKSVTLQSTRTQFLGPLNNTTFRG